MDQRQTSLPPPINLQMRLGFLLCAVLWSAAGCVHTIHVNPLPSAPSAEPIPRSAQLVVRPVSLSGADHMPGINLLRWPHKDFRQALIEYVQRRETFTAVTTTPADLLLAIGTELSLKSRDRYWYRIRLEVEIKEAGRLIKTYVSEQDVEGSVVRWVTASDRVPIETGLQRALDDVFTQIESDRSLYTTGRAGTK